jgi:tetratricopeptide (TPR) repeat protein
MSANLFGAAIKQFNAGRLDQAERMCRDVLMFNREHFDALHMLGLIAMRVGNLNAAAELFGRSLSINARNVDCHFDMAQVLQAIGRTHDAMDHFRQATALKPDHLGAHVMLADMLVGQNVLDEARARYEHVLKLDPRLIEARHGLALVLRQQDRLDESVDQFRQVVALKPDFAEAHSNLGVVLAAQGRWAEAIDAYRRALTLKPGLVDVYRYLARALLAQGHATEALAVVIQGLALGETEEAKALFVQCAKNATEMPSGETFRDMVTRALTEGWGRSAELAPVVAALFAASGGRGDSLSGQDAVLALSNDRLLRALLESAPVRSAEMEQFLTSLRGHLLRQADQTANDAPVGGQTLAIACALARQCFINEYVFSEAEEEAAQAAELRNRIQAALATNMPVNPAWLAAVGSYAPLNALTGSQALLQRSWPDAIQALLSQQIMEPTVERDIAASLPTLTPIEDTVSLEVRRQYEEMPYPRWVKSPSLGQPVAIEWYLRGQFPTAALGSHRTGDGLDVLVAGCGTGQHAIETAQRYAGARVLAIDLSRASLGYATRKTREAKLRNIQYAQADILNLGSLGAQFDLIEASGVLHHLRDPLQGWRVLLSLLRPGGYMHVGLYSAIARADIRAARAFISEREYADTTADIRRCRQELLGCDAGTPLHNVTRYHDFFTTSECRDLLFHVQEHQFTIPQIKDFLAEAGLRFLGFDGPAAEYHRARTPHDMVMTDLDHWHAFETENPVTFVNMYQFWVQKPAPESISARR